MSSSATVLCFVFSVPTKHRIFLLSPSPSLKSFSLLSVQLYPKPHHFKPFFFNSPCTTLPYPSSLCSAWLSLNTCICLCPATHHHTPVLMLFWFFLKWSNLQNGYQGLAHTQELPTIYCVTPCPEKTICTWGCCRFKMQNFSSACSIF